MFHADPVRDPLRTSILQQISKGQLIATISFFLNVFIGFLEVGVGFYIGSLALSADGIHSFVDAVVSLTVWLGIRYAQKKADGTFHYGYYKFDAIFSLFAAVIMIASGMVISYVGIREYLTPALHHDVSIVGVYVALVSVAVAVLLARYKRHYSKVTGLISLHTDAYNSVKDASASVIALAGISLTIFGLYSFDSLAGLVIGVFVMVAGYFAIKESSLVLADAYNNPEMIETIKKITTTVPGIFAIDDLRVRRSGPFLAVEMRIKVDGNMTVLEADRITKEVSLRMRNAIRSLGRIIIKPEPRQDAIAK